MVKLNIGWIDSWQLRDEKDVHPSHKMKVVSVESLEQQCKDAPQCRLVVLAKYLKGEQK